MKAARLYDGDTVLRVEEVPDPTLRPGAVVVRVEAVFVAPYLASLVDGSGGFTTPPRPFTPGMDMVGSVEAVAEGVTGLLPGDAVYCDSYFASGNQGGAEDHCFIGCFAMGSDSPDMLARWPDGALAEKIVLPADCVIPLGAAAEKAAPAVLCRLGWLGTAYGALTKVGLKPGETVTILGASGQVGASAVLIALAMGAAKVHAVGRRASALAPLARLDPRIVVGQDPGAEKGSDVLFSSIEAPDASFIESGLPSLRRHGRAVVVGAPGKPLSLDLAWLHYNDITLRGSLWFPRAAVPEMLAMIAGGTLDLSCVETRPFDLDQVNGALAATRLVASGLEQIVVTP